MVPYGLLADRFGILRIMMLSVLGIFLADAWYDVVCKFSTKSFASRTLICCRLAWLDMATQARMAFTRFLPGGRRLNSIRVPPFCVCCQYLSS